MSYLLRAGTRPRSQIKFSGLGLMRMAIANGGGAGSIGPIVRPLPGVLSLPLPSPAVQISPTKPIPQLFPPGTPTAPNATGGGGSPTTAGTPVPAGFPRNQFFVAPDGSVWEYSVSGNTWLNTGTPYNVGGAPAPASPAGAGGAPASPAITGGPGAPVSVTVATPSGAPATSGYQAILDWLTQSTLISPVPNWVVGAGVAFVAWKLMGSTTGKGH